MSVNAESMFEPDNLSFQAAECIAFVSDNQTHGVVSAVVQQFFADAVVRDGDCSGALAYLSEVPPPSVLIVDIGESNQPLSAMLSLTAAFSEDVRLIGIGAVNDISLYRELTDAGVTDYLVKPVTEKALAAALSRPTQTQAAQPVAESGSDKSVRVVVVGARGGVGASTTAVNLAWILAEEEKKRTALIDLDLEFGTVALSLDLEPSRGLREALETPARIDGLFVSSASATLTDNLSVMATEENLHGGHHFNPNAVEILLETLSHEKDCIVIDLPRSLYGVREQVLQQATRIVLVTELSLPALRDSIRLLGIIEETVPDVPITIIANRCKSAHQAMAVPEFQKALGRKVDIMLGDESKAFNAAANNGKPLVHNDGRNKAAKGLRKIAALAVERDFDEEGEESGKKNSWFKLSKTKKSTAKTKSKT